MTKMINDDYVTLEQAKILKEKGFPHQTWCSYVFREDWSEETYSEISESKPLGTYSPFGCITCMSESDIAMPTLSIVHKWLIEEKKIFIDITFGILRNEIFWCSSLNNLDCSKQSMICDAGHMCKSYVEALSIGIDKALELI